jgi:hypothetical protein
VFSPPVAGSNSSSVRLAVERSAPVRVAPTRIALERSASESSALERSASERFAPMSFGSIERFSPPRVPRCPCNAHGYFDHPEKGWSLTTFYMWPATSVGMLNLLFVTTLPPSGFASIWHSGVPGLSLLAPFARVYESGFLRR